MNFRQKYNRIEAQLKWEDTNLLEKEKILNFSAFGDTKIIFYVINQINRNEISKARKKSFEEKEYLIINREQREFNFYIPHSIILNREDITRSIFKRDTGNLYTAPKDTKDFDNLEVWLYYPERVHNIGRPKIR